MAYKIYKGHNSPFLVEIEKINGSLYTSELMSGITRVYLKYIPSDGASAEYADSDTHTDVFDWDKYASRGKLYVDIGLLDFTVGRDTAAELVVYDETYTEGRVIEQLDITISDDALGDVETADVLSIIEGGGGGGAVDSVFGRTGVVVATSGDYDTSQIAPSVLNKTDNYTVTTSDLRQPIVMNAATNKAVALPSVGGSEDGEWLEIIKAGSGEVAINAADSDNIGASGTTALTMDGTGYGHVKLIYIHAITTWIIERSGSIQGS